MHNVVTKCRILREKICIIQFTFVRCITVLDSTHAVLGLFWVFVCPRSHALFHEAARRHSVARSGCVLRFFGIFLFGSRIN